MMNDSPRFCQIDDSDTANIAQLGSLSQSTRTRPTTGLNRKKNSTDVTATELASVELKIVWNTLMPASRRCAATASSTPRISPAGTV
jgi:hypothetical protein